MRLFADQSKKKTHVAVIEMNDEPEQASHSPDFIAFWYFSFYSVNQSSIQIVVWHNRLIDNKQTIDIMN